MQKMNCWDMKKCGRASGGGNCLELGVCPAASEQPCDGMNHGKNGGRICWAVAGTFCGGKPQGMFVNKQPSCMSCEVFKQIKAEEGTDFSLMKKAV